jgi:hypothetical protein
MVDLVFGCFYELQEWAKDDGLASHLRLKVFSSRGHRNFPRRPLKLFIQRAQFWHEAR